MPPADFVVNDHQVIGVAASHNERKRACGNLLDQLAGSVDHQADTAILLIMPGIAGGFRMWAGRLILKPLPAEFVDHVVKDLDIDATTIFHHARRESCVA